jgi:hypothetical protein
MVSEVAGVDTTVAAPAHAPAVLEPVDVVRCWWCDQPIGVSDDRQYQMCVNPTCEAYKDVGINWDEEPLCTYQVAGGYGRTAVSPPEYCEHTAAPGTSRCGTHTEDEEWDEPYDDEVFLVEGHEHNDYGM